MILLGYPRALDNLKDDEIILSSTIMHLSPGALVRDNGGVCLFACERAIFCLFSGAIFITEHLSCSHSGKMFAECSQVDTILVTM